MNCSTLTVEDPYVRLSLYSGNEWGLEGRYGKRRLLIRMDLVVMKVTGDETYGTSGPRTESKNRCFSKSSYLEKNIKSLLQELLGC